MAVGRGLTAPEILARDLDKGLLLLGDFGNARLRETLDADPERERELYERATDVLVHLHSHPPMAGLPPHGLDQWLEELKLFTDWYCPAVGAEVDVEAYRRRGREVLEPVASDGLGRSRCCAIIMPRTSCWSRAARASGISGCSISRTRLPATLPMTSPRCSRMRGATSRRRSSAR